MGTRATVKFFEQYGAESECICAVYHHDDGGLSEVGYDLADLLHRRKIINGMKFGMDMSQYANGMGCLAAQYVVKVKTNLGGVYMTSAENTQEFNYHVEVKRVDGEEVLHIRAWHFDELLFEGGAMEFLRACSAAKNGVDLLEVKTAAIQCMYCGVYSANTNHVCDACEAAAKEIDQKQLNKKQRKEGETNKVFA